MHNAVDMSHLFEEVQGALNFGNGHGRENVNAIVEYLLDFHSDPSFDTVASFVRQMGMASCAAGSFGEDTIYTHLILQKLGDPEWREAIEQAVEGYQDATGDAPNFGDSYDGQGFHLENVVTFAVDWWSHAIASILEQMDKVYVAVTDMGGVCEERVAFSQYEDAADYIEEWVSSSDDNDPDLCTILEERL